MFYRERTPPFWAFSAAQAKPPRCFFSTSNHPTRFQHIYSNMINLPSPLDPSSQHKLIDFINSLDPHYYYLFFFYTYLQTFPEDFKGRGPRYFYTGIFLHHHLLRPTPNSSSHCSLNCFSELAKSFSTKIHYFEEFEDLFYGEQRLIQPNEIIMLKVFNLGDLKHNNTLVNRFGYEIPGYGYDEFSLDPDEAMFYTGDYSTPIALHKDNKKIMLHPNKALIFLADGIRYID